MKTKYKDAGIMANLLSVKPERHIFCFYNVVEKAWP